ncbi:MAG: signal peptidase I [Actinomycetota bacterium]
MSATVELLNREGEADVPEGIEIVEKKRRPFWRPLLAIVVVLLGVRSFLVETVTVHGSSMSPGIRDGDVLVVDRLTYRFRDPRPGEVVVTTDPVDGKLIVKRVVAVGGQNAGIEDGHLMVDGLIFDEAYVNNAGMAGYYFGPNPVPQGEVLLLGDDRDLSVDSRAFGTVSVDSITGRVLTHLWPLGGHD